MAKFVYNYSPATGEFLLKSVADESPLEPDVILLPAYATLIAPPQTKKNEVAVFLNGNWINKPDWRLIPLFLKENGSSIHINEIGIVPAEISATELAPPVGCYKWLENKWVIDSHLIELRNKEAFLSKNKEINVWRDIEELQPIKFFYAGREWDGGVKIRDRLQSASAQPELPKDYFWTDAQNIDVPITLIELKLLNSAHEAALVERGFRIHQHQRVMKNEIEKLSGDVLINYQPRWVEEKLN